MEKVTLVKALAEARCPQCRQSKMFKTGPLNWNFDQMEKQCDHCELIYEVEPGFFIGAMYFSYAMVVGLLVIIGLVLYHIFGDPHLLVYIISVPVVVLMGLPFIFRSSRVLFLYMFGGVSYRPTSNAK
jgi:uncharacterized protein (DUF983 family)